ncbi:MAG: HAD-IIB family hydrolase [Gammaproteobacteria bacterium]
MQALERMPRAVRQGIRGVFTDIDDTLTANGRLGGRAYCAMERLREAGLLVVPVTGRPAGWCDHIARMWPVDAVVGENGAFYFRYDGGERRMLKAYVRDASQRSRDRERLNALAHEILAAVPGAAVAGDQAYRESDLAIDFCEDVPRLGDEAVARIVECFESAGATAKISSIHVNGWFGDYDKLGMTRRLMRECFDTDLDSSRDVYTFAGDAPNDSPMFGFFTHSVGVANVRAFAGRLQAEPAYVTSGAGGEGFAELADWLLSA